VQSKLKTWGYYTGTVDGIYGSKTIAAVKKFQQANGLVADGIAGPKTLAKMGITLGVSVTSSYIQAGSSAADIKKVQQRLKDLGYYKMTVDGIYGSGTISAVKKFQSDNYLSPDGIVGPKTLAKLGITTVSGTASGSSDSNAYLMAKAIYAEARGEPYTGKVAVGAVILNRVKSPDFPNTIAGVIYQPGAFTAVSDGQINLSPDSEAQKAAQDALNGWDPTYGCLFYYNPAKTTNKWIYSRPVVITIGTHVFCK
jgi:spore cortex-lytic enzyme